MGLGLGLGSRVGSGPMCNIQIDRHALREFNCKVVLQSKAPACEGAHTKDKVVKTGTMENKTPLKRFE